MQLVVELYGRQIGTPGLLHPEDAPVRLAPAYDVVPHTHLPGADGRMAMSVAGQYRHAEITRALRGG